MPLTDSSARARLSGFPPRFKDLSLEDCEGEGWHNHFREALQLIKSGGIAVIYGDVGTGKTRMCYEIAKKLAPRSIKVCGLPKEQPCIYTTADGMLCHLRKSFGTEADRESEHTTIERYQEATLVAIDEVDGSIASLHGQRKFKQVVDERYQRALPTIIATNFDRRQLMRALPAPVIDRIRECGAGFHFDWPSFRGR